MECSGGRGVGWSGEEGVVADVGVGVDEELVIAGHEAGFGDVVTGIGAYGGHGGPVRNDHELGLAFLGDVATEHLDAQVVRDGANLVDAGCAEVGLVLIGAIEGYAALPDAGDRGRHGMDMAAAGGEGEEEEREEPDHAVCPMNNSPSGLSASLLGITASGPQSKRQQCQVLLRCSTRFCASFLSRVFQNRRPKSLNRHSGPTSCRLLGFPADSTKSKAAK